MTRQLSVTKEFEQGTLLDVTLYPNSTDDGPSHTYYVPEKAQRHAGRQKLTEMDSHEAVLEDEGPGYDWEEVKSLVPATKIVEWAEEEVLHRADGDIGQSKPFGFGIRPGGSQRTDLPPGVVKFGTPDPDDDNRPDRDPLERGYCWAAVHNRVRTESGASLLRYQSDVESALASEARVPLDVVDAGQAAVAAYLVAHDHHSRCIVRTLDLDAETFRELLEEFTEEARVN